MVRISAEDDGYYISGFDASATQADKSLINVGSYPIILKHQNTGSLEENRIIIPGNLDISLAPNDTADIWYDSVTQMWRIRTTTTRRNNADELPLLSGIAAHDINGWKTVGGFIFDTNAWAYETSTLQVVLNTSDISQSAQVRLWNVTTGAQVGTTITSISLTPEKQILAVTMTTGENIYEIQIKPEADTYIATCYGAKLILE